MGMTVMKIRMNVSLNVLLFYIIIALLVMPASSEATTNTSLTTESTIDLSDITSPYFNRILTEENIVPRDDVLFDGSWSPDGSKILLRLSYDDLTRSSSALYILNADGTEVKELAVTRNNTGSSPLIFNSGSTAQWNPSGDRFASTASLYRITGFYIISDINGTFLRAVGTDFTTMDSIRKNAYSIPYQECFSWNPDGTDAIVVIANQLYHIDRDGSILQQLTNESVERYICDAFWNHKGDMIAFCGDNLWIVNRDGTGLRQIASNACRLQGWSVDDSKLYYSSYDTNESRSLYVVQVNSSQKRKIATGKMGDYLIAGPDGKVAFTGCLDNNGNPCPSNLYVADSDGNNQELLAKSDQYDAFSNGIWSPDGSYIAYSSGVISSNGSQKYDIEMGDSFSWDNSGKYVGFTDLGLTDVSQNSLPRVCILKPASQELMSLSSEEDGFFYRGWSPDGNRILLGSFEDISVIKLSGCDEVMSLNAPASITAGKEFSILIKSMSSPVQGARITLDGAEIGQSSPTGHFTYAINKSGTYVLNASKEGFVNTGKLLVVVEEPVLDRNNISENVSIQDSTGVPGFCITSTLIALNYTVILLRRRK